MSKTNRYTRLGYKDRAEYLHSLSEEYGVGYDLVLASADMFGESEDFDGLISTLQDLEEMGIE